MPEALTSVEEAVAISRRLATGNPAAYGPELAMSLSMLAGWRAEMKTDLAGALQAIMEAVTICRQLDQAVPHDMPADLAGMVHGPAVSLAETLEELSRTQEAVELRRGLGHSMPASRRCLLVRDAGVGDVSPVGGAITVGILVARGQKVRRWCPGCPLNP